MALKASIRIRPPETLPGVGRRLGNSVFCVSAQNLKAAIVPLVNNMHLGTKLQTDSDAVPLHGAVLCVDCECVTNGLSDECLVCGSRSLFSLARLLGGTRLSPKANYSSTGKAVLFDVEIAINLKQIEPRELNAAVEGITNLIVPTLVRGPASFHINVEPVVACRNDEELKAA